MPLKNRFFHANTEYNTFKKHVSAPILRKAFSYTSGKVNVKVIGLGFYRLFVNGKDITKGELAPFIANPDHIVYLDEYDITEHLSEGENVVGLMLGNGMQSTDVKYWGFCENVFRSAPKFSFSLTVDDEELFDAGDFLWSESPYYFDDLRSGVFYDARLEQKGWCEKGFDDSNWKKVTKAESARGEVRTKVSPDVVVYDEVAPVSVKPSNLKPEYVDAGQHDLGGPYLETAQDRTGGYLYDFGVNTAAIFRLKVKGDRGQKISLQFCEVLDSDGRPSYDNLGYFPDGYVQRDIYILKGEGEEVFVPAFTYHGYRYCYVTGITEAQATKELVTMLKVSDDFVKLGEFSCSDKDINTLQEMVVNSNLSNFVHFPTDCPHREKNGWTGDATVSAEQMLLNHDVTGGWREWLCNIRAAQKESGQIPCIVPTESWGYEWGTGPIWDNVLFELPYMAYIYRGNDTLIKENATAMFRYLHYVDKKRRDDGMVCYGLGDWSETDMRFGTPTWDFSLPKAPLEFVDTAAIYDASKKAAFMFDVIGYKKEKAYAEALAEELLTLLRKRCINHGTATAIGRCQTTQAVAIALGIFEDCELYNAGRVLEEIIADDGGRFDGGFYGMRYLFHALSITGRSDLAYKLIMREEYPSYKWTINEGMTALPEGFKTKESFSYNHHFFGDISHWFYRWLGGINVNPYGDNANYVEICPRFIDALSDVKASYVLSGGKVSVKWEKHSHGKVSVFVEADEDVKVRFLAPEGYAVTCPEDKEFDGMRILDNIPEEILLKKVNS
ncbi:MAG: hypothetical protein E7561_03670 [Ruminococcaceae bacterium]|nr:hypothetical protein [Oscillospiraceae bacterium]